MAAVVCVRGSDGVCLSMYQFLCPPAKNLIEMQSVNLVTGKQNHRDAEFGYVHAVAVIDNYIFVPAPQL